jgi:hypothetical protein
MRTRPERVYPDEAGRGGRVIVSEALSSCAAGSGRNVTFGPSSAMKPLLSMPSTTSPTSDSVSCFWNIDATAPFSVLG